MSLCAQNHTHTHTCFHYTPSLHNLTTPASNHGPSLLTLHTPPLHNPNKHFLAFKSGIANAAAEVSALPLLLLVGQARILCNKCARAVFQNHTHRHFNIINHIKTTNGYAPWHDAPTTKTKIPHYACNPIEIEAVKNIGSIGETKSDGSKWIYQNCSQEADRGVWGPELTKKEAGRWVGAGVNLSSCAHSVPDYIVDNYKTIHQTLCMNGRPKESTIYISRPDFLLQPLRRPAVLDKGTLYNKVDFAYAFATELLPQVCQYFHVSYRNCSKAGGLVPSGYRDPHHEACLLHFMETQGVAVQSSPLGRLIRDHGDIDSCRSNQVKRPTRCVDDHWNPDAWESCNSE